VLTSSNKHKLASMALMALAVTTLIGTPGALAQEVSVSGSVGCVPSTTTLTSASHPGMGNMARGTSKSVDLTFKVQRGIKNAACDLKAGTVTAAIFSGGGKAGCYGRGKQNHTSIRENNWIAWSGESSCR